MQQFTGINAIVTQIGGIVSQHNPVFGYYVPLILNVIQSVSTIGAIFAIKRFGRRPIILWGNFLLGAFNIVLGIFFIFIEKSTIIFWLVFAFLILYNIIYGVTLGPAVWLYVP
jgi:SP family sugar:H+ symporter-like MFS transporter